MSFLSDLKSGKIMLFDGAMGTQLEKLGGDLSGGGKNNLTHPEIVLKVHQEYVESGAQVLITNTFTMNPIYVLTHNINVDLDEVNQAGVELARQAAKEEQFVMGGLGPTGQMLQPFGTYSEDDFYQGFKQQADILAASGIDGFIIETMFDVNEALCALRACRESADLPVIVSLTLSGNSDGGRTMMGQTMPECAAKLEKGGADVIGINCGDLDPEEIAQVVMNLKGETSLPIMVEPNAGKPKLSGGKTCYDMTPEIFADGIGKCLEAGASLVGGCCGTTPNHIRAVAKLLQNR